MVTLISDADYARVIKDVSLDPEEPGPVWGAAYHIPPEHVGEVLDYLGLREINGYSIQRTTFLPAEAGSGSHIEPLEGVIAYVGLPSNPQFLGHQTQDDLAAVIVKNVGPSGLNRDYLFELEKALVALGATSGDEHISDLVRRVKRLLGETGQVGK